LSGVSGTTILLPLGCVTLNCKLSSQSVLSVSVGSGFTGEAYKGVYNCVIKCSKHDQSVWLTIMHVNIKQLPTFTKLLLYYCPQHPYDTENVTCRWRHDV